MTIKLTEKIAVIDTHGYLASKPDARVYDELMQGESADMMLESATIDELDITYLGNELIHSTHTAMFEAVTSERMRLSQTMRAFVRALGRGMNGTGIKAGTDDAGVDDDGNKTIGGAIIGKVRRVNNIPIMTALIPLSDGQSISLVFHSPTADGGRIKNKDLLVAFRFLLNKRDVTHIVAPIGGRDVSLQQVSQALANLAERNSAKFVKQQSSQAKLRGDIDALSAENEQLSEQQSSMLEQVDTLQQKLIGHQTTALSLREKLASQRRINAELEEELKMLQGDSIGPDTNMTEGKVFADTTRQVKNALSIDGLATLSNGAKISYGTQDVDGDLIGSVRIVETSGRVFLMTSPSSQGGAMGNTATKLLKAYRERNAARFEVNVPEIITPPELAPTPKPDPTPEQTAEKYRYALSSRPAGIGAVPTDHSDILPAPVEGEKYSSLARHGFIEYVRKLTEQEASNFELKLIPTQTDLDELAQTVVTESMGDYAQQYVEMAAADQAMFDSQLKLTTKKVAPNIAYPEGDDLAYYLQAVKDVLSSKITNKDGLGETAQEEENMRSESDKAADGALSYLDTVMHLQTADLAEIRDARNKVRGAIAALQAAGRFEENEERVNGAAQHLSDLLVAIQRAGVEA